MSKVHDPHECPHMLKMFDTPVCIVSMEPCYKVENCPRDKKELTKEKSA